MSGLIRIHMIAIIASFLLSSPIYAAIHGYSRFYNKDANTTVDILYHSSHKGELSPTEKCILEVLKNIDRQNTMVVCHESYGSSLLDNLTSLGMKVVSTPDYARRFGNYDELTEQDRYLVTTYMKNYYEEMYEELPFNDNSDYSITLQPEVEMLSLMLQSPNKRIILLAGPETNVPVHIQPFLLGRSFKTVHSYVSRFKAELDQGLLNGFGGEKVPTRNRVKFIAKNNLGYITCGACLASLGTVLHFAKEEAETNVIQRGLRLGLLVLAGIAVLKQILSNESATTVLNRMLLNESAEEVTYKFKLKRATKH